jgi:hypothetical protein
VVFWEFETGTILEQVFHVDIPLKGAIRPQSWYCMGIDTADGSLGN